MVVDVEVLWLGHVVTPGSELLVSLAGFAGSTVHLNLDPSKMLFVMRSSMIRIIREGEWHGEGHDGSQDADKKDNQCQCVRFLKFRESVKCLSYSYEICLDVEKIRSLRKCECEYVKFSGKRGWIGIKIFPMYFAN